MSVQCFQSWRSYSDRLAGVSAMVPFRMLSSDVWIVVGVGTGVVVGGGAAVCTFTGWRRSSTIGIAARVFLGGRAPGCHSRSAVQVPEVFNWKIRASFTTLRLQMVDHQNVQAGDAFAGAFQNAFVAAMRDHQNLRLYEVHVLKPNTMFMLTNGQMEMVVDTKLRRTTINQTLFGINAAEWFAWQQPGRDHLPVVRIVQDADGQEVRLNREWRPVAPVAILGYASYRPVDERLVAQWINLIEAAVPNGDFVDTQLDSYATLSAVLQGGIGINVELAHWIEHRTLRNALDRPILEPDAP